MDKAHELLAGYNGYPDSIDKHSIKMDLKMPLCLPKDIVISIISLLKISYFHLYPK